MTSEEFINTYSRQKAEQIQAEMLAAGNRRPKTWTYVTSKNEDGEAISRLTIYFDGCPFRLKSSGMVDWLQALLLWNEAEEPHHNFTAQELLDIGIASINLQLSGDFWVYDPSGFPSGIARWANRAEDFDSGIALMNEFIDIFVDIYNADNQRDSIRMECDIAQRICALNIVDFSIKAGNITDLTYGALEQILSDIDEEIREAEEEGEQYGVPFHTDIYEMLINMIPQIEASGDEQLIRTAYEIVMKYYQFTRRRTLADKYAAALKEMDNKQLNEGEL
ncbi:MAG: hypothetical protein K2K79_06445 [Paramuribaculum sp.]|nr:hypothetical protein [Paramuribaculum sp.]